MQNLDADDALVTLAGSRNITVAGAAQRLQIRLSGSGNVDAMAVRSDALEVLLDGSGKVTAYAARIASVRLAGSGDVIVMGQPGQRNVQQSGSGSVRFS